MESEKITPFKISFAREGLSDLQRRLENTRWTCQLEGVDWDAGTDLNYLKELVSYWRSSYHWRKQEEILNRFSHFRTDGDGIAIHFIHERGNAPTPFRSFLHMVIRILFTVLRI